MTTATALAAPGRIAAARQGSGPVVVLLHGVALGPGTLATAARMVASGGATAVVPHRGGYGESGAVPPRQDMDAQVDDVLGVLDGLGAARAVLAGVSGGATIALATAMRAPERVTGAVLHEPALGPLARALDARLRAAAADVACASDPGEGALTLARALAGPGGWAAVDAAARADAREAGPVVRAEIGLFPAFAPTAEALRRLRGVPLTSSVGARSGVERQEAAAVLTRLAGARAVRTPSGHLVQLEAPGAFAAAALALALPDVPPTRDEEDR